MTSPTPPPDPSPGATHRAIAERAARSGIRRVHLLAFRDLDDAEAGGSELHAREVVRHLARAGLEVVHRTGRVRGAPGEVHRDGARVVRRGGRLGVFPGTALDERRGRLGPVDGIIEVFHGIPFFAPWWAPRTPQVGLVHHVHLGVWHHLLPAPGAALGHALERFAVPRAYRGRTVVTIAGSTREEVLRSYGLQPDRVGTVPNGVDERFTPGGDRSPVPLVVAVARLMPQKAVPELVAAFAAVRAVVPTARLAVVGSGPEAGRVAAAVAAHGLEDAVDLVGHVPSHELADWYRRAWVVASASVREGFGLTLLEAAACGTPAVASRIPGHTDAVDDGRTGLLAERGPAFADALVEVLTDDGLRHRLGSAALAHAGGFRWEGTALGLVEALCDDADRRR